MAVPKDQILYVTEEEQEGVEEDVLAESNALGPDGEIDWDCPCLQGMASTVCGEDFKAAFSCFVNSKSEVKGSECIEYFGKLHECMAANVDKYEKPKASSSDDAAADASASASGAEAGSAAAGAAEPTTTTAASS
eukprot:m.34148 g.34148  ORF g.34148 m.34148 type:complete len:135 (+) comp11108_c0_seq1:157-561(+)